MKKYIFIVVSFLFGIVVGGGVFWISSHKSERTYSNKKIGYEQLLKHSDVKISKNNFHCENYVGRDVAAIFGSILEFNDNSIRNKLTLQCWGAECALMVSSCLPWQSQECGQRALKFELNKKNEIIPSTFKCFDIP